MRSISIQGEARKAFLLFKNYFAIPFFVVFFSFVYSYKLDYLYTNGDVGAFLLESENIHTLFGVSLQGHTHIFFYYFKLLYSLFGDTFYLYQLASIFWGLLCLTFLFLTLLHIYGWTSAYLVTFIFGFTPYFIVLARHGNELTLILATLMISVYACLKSTSSRPVIVAGLVSGCSLYFSPIAAFTVLLSPIILLVWRKKPMLFLSYIGTVIFVFLPQIMTQKNMPGIIFERASTVSFFHTPAWQNTQLDIIIPHLSASFLPFFKQLPQSGVLWYNNLPFLPSWLTAVAILGLAVSLRTDRKIAVMLLLWFILGSLLAGFATVDITASRYSILIPCFFVVIASFVHYLVQALVKSRKSGLFVIGVIFSGLIYLTACFALIKDFHNYYFVQLQTFSLDDEFLARSSDALQMFDENHITTIYFLTTNVKYYNSNPDFAFKTRAFQHTDIHSMDEMREIILSEKNHDHQRVIVVPQGRIPDMNVLLTERPLKHQAYRGMRNNEIIGMLVFF